MSTAVLPARMTVDAFLERPERMDGFYEELIEGRIYVSPNVKKRHNDLVRRIERLLQPLEEKGFLVFGEVACRVTNESLPNTDVAVVRKERWDSVSDDDFIRESPALVVEVQSPGNRQLHRKAAIYLEHGAEQVWIVYPKSQRVRVLTPDDDRDVRLGETLEFEGIRIPVEQLFS
jgi:Uma2 family endonuclease